MVDDFLFVHAIPLSLLELFTQRLVFIPVCICCTQCCYWAFCLLLSEVALLIGSMFGSAFASGAKIWEYATSEDKAHIKERLLKCHSVSLRDSYCLQLNWPNMKVLISVYCSVLTGCYSSCHYGLSGCYRQSRQFVGSTQQLQGAGREEGQGCPPGAGTRRDRGVVAGCDPGHGCAALPRGHGHLWLLPACTHAWSGTSTPASVCTEEPLQGRHKDAGRGDCSRIFNDTSNGCTTGDRLLHLCAPLCAAAFSNTLPNPFVSFPISISTWLWIWVCNSLFKEAATIPYSLICGKIGSYFYFLFLA